MAERLTDRLVRRLEPPPAASRVTYDADVPGFGVRVTAKGYRAFVLNFVVHKRERRLTIGSFPQWTTAAARDEALRLRKLVDQQIDPIEHRRTRDSEIEAERNAPTLFDLFEQYRDHHLAKLAPRSAADQASMWSKLMLPEIGTTKVKDLTSEAVDRLHANIAETRPVRANRCLESLRKALSLAVRWDWRADNPAQGFRRHPENPRQRYLSEEELERLVSALEQHPRRASADAILFMLLTGARRGEVLGATWSMFDLVQGVWTKPSAHTKQRREHRVPLSEAALAVLRRRREQDEGLYVFASKDQKPLTEVRKTWASVCEAADIGDCRLHDLRHSYASVLASSGASLPIIGALLGHTQPGTTQRYAHLFDGVLREATSSVGARLLRET